MKCSRCGAELPEGAVYCGECGSKVESSKRTDSKPRGRSTLQASRRQRRATADDASTESAVAQTTQEATEAIDAIKTQRLVEAAQAAASAAAAGAASQAQETQSFADAAEAAPQDLSEAPTKMFEPVDLNESEPMPLEGGYGAYEEPVADSAMRPVIDHPDRVVSYAETQRRRGRRGAIAAVLLALALLGAAGAAWFFTQQANSEAETQAIVKENEEKAQQAKQEAEAARAQEAEDERLRGPRNVKFSVSGINYDSSSTRIPLQILGTTAEGESINETQFVGSYGSGVMLPPGEYSATVMASPMTSAGMIYTIPTDPMDFKISQDVYGEVITGQGIILMPIEANGITTEMVDLSYTWAVKDPQNNGRADVCKAAADKIIADNKAKTEAEAKKAEQEALKKDRPRLAQEFVSNYFTNVIFIDSNDDSQLMVASDWADVALTYVKPGTGLAASLSGETSGEYYSARSVTVSSQGDNTVTVRADVASAKEIAPGWTNTSWPATVKCTFEDDNKISSMEITTPSGTTTY